VGIATFVQLSALSLPSHSSRIILEGKAGHEAPRFQDGSRRSTLVVRAQQKAMPVIGVLMGAIPSGEAAKIGVFRDALKQLGYVEGQTILIDRATGRVTPTGFPCWAHDIVARVPAVIVCVGRQVRLLPGECCRWLQ
jgi:hypothetical protein